MVVGVIFVAQSGGVGGFLDEASELHGLGMGQAITAVVGSWIAGAVMGVDMFRFNKSVKAVWGCAAACFILTNPILNIVGYIGTVHIGDFNYVLWMLGVNLLVAILGVVVWTTALWTTDNSELYCNALYTGPSLNALGINIPRKKLVSSREPSELSWEHLHSISCSSQTLSTFWAPWLRLSALRFWRTILSSEERIRISTIWSF